jgi:DNA-binding protein H-NS
VHRADFCGLISGRDAVIWNVNLVQFHTFFWIMSIPPLIKVGCGNIGRAQLQGGGMSIRKLELESMSLDDLWSLHEEISGILSARIKAEKHELEKRLAVLGGGMAVSADPRGVETSLAGKPRRKYPRVLPKYRNPQTSETWSGRGKRPRWLVAAMKSGRKIEEFRLGEASPKVRQRA